MNGTEFRAQNMALEGCPLCVNEHLFLHLHRSMVFVPSAHPSSRAYGVSPSRPQFYHGVGRDARQHLVCSCEHGQKKARRFGYGELLDPCCHEHWRLYYEEHANGQPLRMYLSAGGLAVVEAVTAYELEF